MKALVRRAAGEEIRSNEASMADVEGGGVLLLAVPFTASTTKAMEMNKAMTSSVDLETHVSIKVR